MPLAPGARPSTPGAARRVRAVALPFALLLFVLCVLGAWQVSAEPAFPALTGRVVDNAGLLGPEDEAEIVKRLESLEKRMTDQLVLVTLPSLQGYPIEDFGYRLGRHWGIGQKDKDNGVLLIVAPNERKVRIEVGRGLEGVLPDAIAKIIIENAILPRFRAGDFPGGIKAGLRDIELVLTGDAEEVKALAPRDIGPEYGWVAAVIGMAWLIIFLTVVTVIAYSSIQGAMSSGRRGATWGGSSGGGWSGGGGGFSGGGGGFGGGGASGGW